MRSRLFGLRNSFLTVSLFVGQSVSIVPVDDPDRKKRFKRFAELQRELAELAHELNLREGSIPHDRPKPLGVEAYQSLGEHGQDLISIHASDGTYGFVSPNAQRLFYLHPDEMVGRSPYTFFHSDDVDPIAAHDATQGSGAQPPIRYRFRCGDGTYRWVETRSHARTTEHGVEQIVCITRDVDDEERQRVEAEELQAQLQISERMVSLGTLAGGLATRSIVPWHMCSPTSSLLCKKSKRFPRLEINPRVRGAGRAARRQGRRRTHPTHHSRPAHLFSQDR